MSYLDEEVRFTVVGRGVFPADMLRHDKCYPVDGEINAITNPVPSRVRPEVSVTLCGVRRLITPDRWRSFGWVVTEIDGNPAPFY